MPELWSLLLQQNLAGFFLRFPIQISQFLNFLNFELLTVSFCMRPTIKYELRLVKKNGKKLSVSDFQEGVKSVPPHGSQGILIPWVIGLRVGWREIGLGLWLLLTLLHIAYFIPAQILLKVDLFLFWWNHLQTTDNCSPHAKRDSQNFNIEDFMAVWLYYWEF